MKKTSLLLIAMLFVSISVQSQTYRLEFATNDTIRFVQSFEKKYADGDKTIEESSTLVVGVDSMRQFLYEKVKEQSVFLQKYTSMAMETENRISSIKKLIDDLKSNYRFGTPKTPPLIINTDSMPQGEYVWDGKSLKPKPAAEPSKKSPSKKKAQ